MVKLERLLSRNSMGQSALEQIRWTVADLDLLPDNGTRYEIIDGELFMTRAPRWSHQRVADKICAALNQWSEATALGEATTAPGIIFSEVDNVIPDVVWVSAERLPLLLDEAEHLTGAPALVVEVLSPGEKNKRRDRQVKLKLDASHGVQEYWIVDRRLQQVQIYRRQQVVLHLVNTVLAGDDLTSPLLPGFSWPVARLFQ